MLSQVAVLTIATDIGADEPVRFCGLRRVYGEAEIGGDELPGDARIHCRRGAAPRSGRYCQDCRRLLTWQPGVMDGDIMLRCVWTDADPVSARMTARAALVAVQPSLRGREAARLAQRHAVHQLLVIDGEALVGVICRRQLARHPGDRVDAWMERQVYVVPPTATLGQAAAAMRRLGIGCLPVLRDDRLVGIITRGDLVRSGLPAATFAR